MISEAKSYSLEGPKIFSTEHNKFLSQKSYMDNTPSLDKFHLNTDWQ